MRVNLQELMNQLGVGFIPGPYESVPWSCTDSTGNITCSAEVRLGMDGNEVEGEIQFLYDTPPDGKGHMEHICMLRATPANEGQWSVVSFLIRNLPYGQDAYDWEGKACVFFQSVVHKIMENRMPDIDALLDEAFHKTEQFAGTRGGGGGKAPKIKPGQMLNPKGGRGF